METMTYKNHKFSFLIYLLLANGITWLCWIPGLVIGAQQGYAMPGFNTFPALFEDGFTNTQHRLLAVVYMLGVYGPLIGGLVATWMDSGKIGLKTLWQRMIHWNIAGRWYLIILALAFLMPAVPVAVFALTGGFSPSSFTLLYVLVFFFYQLFTSGLGEEPGWRGFLLPRLQKRFTGDKFVWVMGLIWAVWHYPLMIIQNLAGMPEVTVVQAVVMQVVNLAGFTMSIIGISFIYTWLNNRTKSVLLLIIFHALTNTFNPWLVSFLTVPVTVTLFIALMPWAVVLVLQKRLGDDKFLGVDVK